MEGTSSCPLPSAKLVTAAPAPPVPSALAPHPHSRCPSLRPRALHHSPQTPAPAAAPRPASLQVLGTDSFYAYLNKYGLELDPQLEALVGRHRCACML